MTVEIEDQKLGNVKVTPGRLLLEIAIGLFASEEMTPGQAANLAGVSQTQLLKELGRRGICVHYDVEEFEQDLGTLEALRRP